MIFILGSGGFAREVLWLYTDKGGREMISGFVEQNSKREGTLIHGKPVYDAQIIDKLSYDTLFIGAIGSPRREVWLEQIEKKGFAFDVAIHPSVIMGENVNIGKGGIICAGNILTTDLTLGKHCIVNLNCIIGHDVIIDDYVTLNPSVNVAGRVKIGERSVIGIGASIIDKVTIGKNCFIGAGAVVVNDMPDNTLAVGVPAKPVRLLNEEDWKTIF